MWSNSQFNTLGGGGYVPRPTSSVEGGAEDETSVRPAQALHELKKFDYDKSGE